MNTNTNEHTIYNANGDKVGVAVWSGQKCGPVAIGWSCYNLADHFVGECWTVMDARDHLNGFGGVEVAA